MLVVRTAPVLQFAIHSSRHWASIDTVGTTVRYLRHTRSEMYQASQLVERVATTINSGVIDARFNCSAYNCRRGGCIDDKGAKPNYRPPSMHLPATHGRGFNECFY